jgi:hypothetical protein
MDRYLSNLEFRALFGQTLYSNNSYLKKKDRHNNLFLHDIWTNKIFKIGIKAVIMLNLL